jgi:glucose-1-phosphate adenylyltransferase
MTTAADGRVVAFTEKPSVPEPMPDDPTCALGSMGNYLFTTDVLVDILSEDAHQVTDHDFGRTIVPRLLDRHRVYAYNFRQNRVPGVRPHEETAYWRDVGTIAAYYHAQMDLIGPRPAFDLDNARWPIFARAAEGPPVRVLSGHVEDSLLGEGSLVDEARIVGSILGRGVRVGRGAVIEGSIVMDYTEVEEGARLTRAIVDRYNHIPAGTRLTAGAGEIPGLPLHLDPSGIVVVPRGEPTGPLPRAA